MADRLQKHTSIDGVEDSEIVDGVVTQCEVSGEPELEVNERGDDNISKNIDDFNEEYFQDMLDMIPTDGGDDDGGTGSVRGEAEVRRNDEMADENEDDGCFDDDFADEGVADDEEFQAARKNLRETGDEELQRLMSEFVVDYANEEEPISDYIDSDGDIDSDETDEEEDHLIHNRIKVVYDPKCDHKSLKLVIGMRFQDGWQCRSALTTHSIECGKFVQFRKVSKTMCVAKCIPSCPWKIHASVVKKNETFCIKTYGGDHNSCPTYTNNKLLSSKWIAIRYLNVYRVRGDYSAGDLKSDILDRWGYEIPKDRLYKARTLTLEMVRGTVDHHYSLVRRYLAELRRADTEGRFELLLGDDHVFKGMYIGFSALIKGFKSSCRPLIGLDGTHLRTYLGGVLLVAVAKDGNNQMFPIAWAIVEIENEECWTWFMKCLIEDIGIGDGNGYTFISDQQKGLENAVKALSPYAEHRNCRRHIYINWSKTHKGQTLKNMFLNITRSTYPEEYKHHLEILKNESVAAYQDFISKDTHKFCKAFFSSSCVSDMVDNNISETFNGYISNARGKHILHMCEEIRSNLMMRQVKKLEFMSNVTDSICPNIRKILEKLRSQSRTCFPKAALFNRFEVLQYGHKFIVSLRDKECSCREWQISGIPCVHAVACIHRNGLDPANYVNPYFSVERYMLAYQYGLPPLNGEQMWPEVDGFKVKPPQIRKMPGRPKKKRIRSAGEVNPRNPTKMSMKGLTMTCKRCGKPDHNKRTCSNEPMEHPPVEKRKRGRPAKQIPSREGASSSVAASNTSARGRGGATRAGGARGEYGRGVGGVPRGGATGGRGRAGRPPSRMDGTANVMREMNFARSGAGVYIGQGTGNIYFHAPNQTTIHVVHRGNLHAQGASVSGVNQSFNTTNDHGGPPTT